MQQTTLTDDQTTTDDTTTTANTTDREQSANARTMLASPNQRGGDGCCPWCLAAVETFQHHGDDRARCGYCDASIPIGAEVKQVDCSCTVWLEIYIGRSCVDWRNSISLRERWVRDRRYVTNAGVFRN